MQRPRKAVEWFAEQMERKLARDDNKKTGWENKIQAMDLYDLLITEIMELHQAMCQYMDCPSPNMAEAVIQEAADVSNFSMMIAAVHDDKMSKLDRGHDPERMVVDELVSVQEPIVMTQESEYSFRDWWGVDVD